MSNLPGPAFIMVPKAWGNFHSPWLVFDGWIKRNVPAGYVFQPATDHTAAGWVRERRGGEPMRSNKPLG